MADIHEDDGNPAVSERVQLLAKNVYNELEVLINSYGPESIGNLMPLVVSILENLDSALSDNQDNLNAVMELSEENQQLVSQYEKERQHRKEIEEKAILLEENTDKEMARLKELNTTLTLDNKSLSNKIKSQTEQIEKLDNRHEQLKTEYKELHEKNLELVRTVHGQRETIRESAAIKFNNAKNKDEASTPTVTAPGFHDFTSSKSKKKRQQPSLPVQLQLSVDESEEFIGTTPAAFVQSPVDSTAIPTFSAKVNIEEDEDDEGEDLLNLSNNESIADVSVNEQSLFAELGESNSMMSFTGLDDILLENKQLHTDKEELAMQVESLNREVSELKIEKNKLENEKEDLSHRLLENDSEIQKVKKELQENREKLRQANEAVEKATGPEGLRISRLEIAKVLRERNEWKEKYFSLLEQVRMNDELYLFKRKDKKSRWVDYFAALFSSSRRRQLEQSLIQSSSHRPILAPGADTNSGINNQTDYDLQNATFTGAGYSNTNVIPTLKKVGKKEDEVFLTSISWVVPSLLLSDSASPLNVTPVSPNINTCRPMSFQEEGEMIFCATAINPASFLRDCAQALPISKESVTSPATEEKSMSLVWICTGNESLSKVSVLDSAAVGEVLETFAVCSTPISSITAVPSFDVTDADVLSSLSIKTKKSASSATNRERPSSSLATVWMGSDSGVLYVHSAVLQWKKCLHADKLPSGIQAIVHSKGKVFILLQNATLAIFRRFPDGEWDWDNYEIITIAHKKGLSVEAIVAVKYNIWCAVGNTIQVLHSHHLNCEANFTVHASKNVTVKQMLTIGDGVWVAFKNDSLLRLFHAISFAHMQDLDVSPSVHKTIAFGSEKRSSHMPVPISCVVAAQNSLWIGTENGIIMNFPFSHPTIVAEEIGWEVIKEAEVGGQEIPEPFDVKTEEALDASSLVTTSNNPRNKDAKKIASQPFTPFCDVDQVQLSIHCHVNAVVSLVCVPGLVPEDMSMFEPMGGVYIAGDSVKYRPSLFVMSCGEGHLDLRTADKVMQALHAQETGRSGIPTAASLISKKNYIMVWDIIV